MLRDGIILEIEYQKRGVHGISQRPDIILHVPAEESHAPVNENNFAVVALKRRASPKLALADFCKLDKMCETLRYPLAVFINIDSKDHHLQRYTGRFGDRLHAFAVRSEGGTLRIRHAWREQDTLQDSEE